MVKRRNRRVSILKFQLPPGSQVHAFFVNRPHTNVEFTGVGAVGQMPGLKGVLRRCVNDTIASTMV